MNAEMIDSMKNTCERPKIVFKYKSAVECKLYRHNTTSDQIRNKFFLFKNF